MPENPPLLDERPDLVDIITYAGDSFRADVHFLDGTPGNTFDLLGEIRGSAGNPVHDAEFTITTTATGATISLSPTTTRKLWNLRAPNMAVDDLFYTPDDIPNRNTVVGGDIYLQTTTQPRSHKPPLRGVASKEKAAGPQRQRPDPNLTHKTGKTVDTTKQIPVATPPSLDPCAPSDFIPIDDSIAPHIPDWETEVGLPLYPGELARAEYLSQQYLGVWDLQLTDPATGIVTTVLRGRILVISDVTRVDHQPGTGTIHSDPSNVADGNNQGDLASWDVASGTYKPADPTILDGLRGSNITVGLVDPLNPATATTMVGDLFINILTGDIYQVKP